MTDDGEFDEIGVTSEFRLTLQSEPICNISATFNLTTLQKETGCVNDAWTFHWIFYGSQSLRRPATMKIVSAEAGVVELFEANCSPDKWSGQHQLVGSTRPGCWMVAPGTSYYSSTIEFSAAVTQKGELKFKTVSKKRLNRIVQ